MSAERDGVPTWMLDVLAYTRDEIVRSILLSRAEIARHGEIHFVLIGGADWQSNAGQPFATSDDTLWMEAGRNRARRGYVTSHDREIWVGVRATMNEEDVEADRAIAVKAIRDVTLLTDLVSTMYQTSETWYRGVRAEDRASEFAKGPEPRPREDWVLLPLPRSPEARTTTNLRDEHVSNHLLPRFDQIKAVEPSDFRIVIQRAINWHALGNDPTSGISRFLHYWSSIELLAAYFHKNLPRSESGRPTKSEKKDDVSRILSQQVTRENCLRIADECTRALHTSVRDQVAALTWVAGPGILDRVLFQEEDESGRTLHDLRGAVAHGSISQHDRSVYELPASRVEKLRSMSKQVIDRTIDNAKALQSLLTAG